LCVHRSPGSRSPRGVYLCDTYSITVLRSVFYALPWCSLIELTKVSICQNATLKTMTSIIANWKETGLKKRSLTCKDSAGAGGIGGRRAGRCWRLLRGRLSDQGALCPRIALRLSTAVICAVGSAPRCTLITASVAWLRGKFRCGRRSMFHTSGARRQARRQLTWATPQALLQR